MKFAIQFACVAVFCSLTAFTQQSPIYVRDDLCQVVKCNDPQSSCRQHGATVYCRQDKALLCPVGACQKNQDPSIPTCSDSEWLIRKREEGCCGGFSTFQCVSKEIPQSRRLTKEELCKVAGCPDKCEVTADLTMVHCPPEPGSISTCEMPPPPKEITCPAHKPRIMISKGKSCGGSYKFYICFPESDPAVAASI